ncbi:hotdog fold thioesterase [Rhodocaloribacter litoris]|uniref:hotdog fold thioesterase n=1 Tax=Rhodocaloribacter litoris TaxID=2558931 RepID=UPI001421C3CA|nr:hotdog fold thioesterase [Rhodocaloribacter litoris]QXD14640.1 hotdog fold thioesterase [Rhodocaloribacter litoris]GIV59586.1 MAG: esterase [Rhodothermaceae bacterium]
MTPSPSEIWVVRPTLEQLNALKAGTMMEHLGITFVEVGADFVEATMPVDHRTRQPFGLLHGGASVVLAETLGSAAANFCVAPERHYCVGLEVNANHVRAVRSGIVTGRARPLHLGRRTQVWETHIYEEAGRLVCISRLTLAVLERREERPR